MAVQTPRIMSTSSRVRPAGKQQVPHARHQLLGVGGVQETPRPAPIPNGPGRPAPPLRWRPVPRRARFLRGRDGQQGRALVDQQRVAQFPGGQLQRLGHVQRAVLGIGRDVANAVAQRDLGVGEPGFLGAQHDGRHAFGGLSQVRAGQIGRLADVAGRGPRSRTRAVSASQRHRGQRLFQRGVDAGVLQRVAAPLDRPRPPGAGSRPRYGGHQHQFRDPMVLIARAAEPTLPGVAGVHHDETGAGKRRRRAVSGARRPLRKRAIYRPGTVRR